MWSDRKARAGNSAGSAPRCPNCIPPAYRTRLPWRSQCFRRDSAHFATRRLGPLRISILGTIQNGRLASAGQQSAINGTAVRQTTARNRMARQRASCPTTAEADKTGPEAVRLAHHSGFAVAPRLNSPILSHARCWILAALRLVGPTFSSIPRRWYRLRCVERRDALPATYFGDSFQGQHPSIESASLAVRIPEAGQSTGVDGKQFCGKLRPCSRASLARNRGRDTPNQRSRALCPRLEHSFVRWAAATTHRGLSMRVRSRAAAASSPITSSAAGSSC